MGSYCSGRRSYTGGCRSLLPGTKRQNKGKWLQAEPANKLPREVVVSPSLEVDGDVAFRVMI